MSTNCRVVGLSSRSWVATWVATLLAFSGVLVVLRPNLLALGPVALYPLGAALGMSILVLLLFFRAPLASAKALLLNLFSVAAGYGVVVLVFQLGHGSEIFGVAAATEVVPSTVPLAALRRPGLRR